MQERHDILARTIGYLEEEQEALDTGYSLFYFSFCMILFGTLLQIPLFWLYNGPCHPFADILKDYSDDDICKLMNQFESSNNLKCKTFFCPDTKWNDFKTLPTKMKNVVDGSLFLNDVPKASNHDGKSSICYHIQMYSYILY